MLKLPRELSLIFTPNVEPEIAHQRPAKKAEGRFRIRRYRDIYRVDTDRSLSRNAQRAYARR